MSAILEHIFLSSQNLRDSEIFLGEWMTMVSGREPIGRSTAAADVLKMYVLLKEILEGGAKNESAKWTQQRLPGLYFCRGKKPNL